MARTIDFRLSADEYLKLAGDAAKKGDINKNIAYIFKALEQKPDDVEILFSLESAYADIAALNISNDILYRILSMNLSDEQKEHAHFRLASNFAELEAFDVVEYYMRDYADGYDLPIPDEQEDKGLKICYPLSDDSYEEVIQNAYALIRDGDPEEALKILDEIPKNSKSYSAANQAKLICLMFANDTDAVVDNAEHMLKEDNNLAVACSLVTAYLMEDKLDKANEELDKIIARNLTSSEDMLVVLPILINLNRHEDVAEYTKRILEVINPQPNAMLWNAIANYNVGRVDEARSMLLKLNNIFREYAPAAYYLKLIDEEPPSIEYAMDVPNDEKFRRYKQVKNFVGSSPSVQKKLLENEEFRDILNWIFLTSADRMKCMLISKFSHIDSNFVLEFLKAQLIKSDLSFEVAAMIISVLIGKYYDAGIKQIKLNIVAQDRFKKIRFVPPTAIYKLPSTFSDALHYCIADIIFTDETPNVFLHRLTAIVNSIADVDEEGKLVYSSKQREKISRFRSTNTLVGVLLARVYKDDDENVIESTIKRYGLKQKDFEKYYRIVFEDEE